MGGPIFNRNKLRLSRPFNQNVIMGLLVTLRSNYVKPANIC